MPKGNVAGLISLAVATANTCLVVFVQVLVFACALADAVVVVWSRCTAL